MTACCERFAEVGRQGRDSSHAHELARHCEEPRSGNEAIQGPRAMPWIASSRLRES